MVRTDVIRADYPPGDATAEHLVEVARRLEPLFLDGLADVREALALRSALQVVTLEFADGFVVNDPGDVPFTIGGTEASLLVAALDREARSAEWWSEQSFAHDYDDEDERQFLAVRDRIRTLDAVVRYD